MLGLTEGLCEIEVLGETEVLVDGEALAEIEALGETEVEVLGLTEGL